MNLSVEQNGNQLPTMAHAQTEETVRFQEAFNGTSAESDTADVIAELVKSGGRESGERFEERLKEIDMEMGRFDKMRGVFSGDNIEEEIVGIKDQKPTRKADDSIQKLDDRHAENSDRHAENVAGTKGFSQSLVHEANLLSVPITHSALCDISNIMGCSNNSAKVEKVKRTRKKCHARPIENVVPRGVKNIKRLASEVDYSELPCKRRLVSRSGHELSNLMMEVVVQPCQQQ